MWGENSNLNQTHPHFNSAQNASALGSAFWRESTCFQSLKPYFAALFTVKSNSLLGDFPQNLISLEVFSQKTKIQAHALSFSEKV